MARECMNGLTEESMMENGKIIICMEKESTPGKMEDDMKEIISMTESMDSVFIHGKMEDNILVIGKTENNTEKEHTDKQLDKKRRESGKTAKE
jgi:hypothetical protein